MRWRSFEGSRLADPRVRRGARCLDDDGVRRDALPPTTETHGVRFPPFDGVFSHPPDPVAAGRRVVRVSLSALSRGRRDPTPRPERRRLRPTWTRPLSSAPPPFSTTIATETAPPPARRRFYPICFVFPFFSRSRRPASYLSRPHGLVASKLGRVPVSFVVLCRVAVTSAVPSVLSPRSVSPSTPSQSLQTTATHSVIVADGFELWSPPVVPRVSFSPFATPTPRVSPRPLLSLPATSQPQPLW
mmetsp:Transcript_6657/g.14693  ORF Transcript_6657/g.14693 Transcript_6657/m.14693 type:complete len:244 (-) Transcript_6657:336-1067(-)